MYRRLPKSNINIIIEDKIQIWNWNRQRDGWEYAQESFIKSGGFNILSFQQQQQNQQQNNETMPPTLFIWGKNDILQYMFGGSSINKYIPSSRRINSTTKRYDITNCGHFPHLEKPKETAMAIEEFLISIEEESTT